MFRLDIQTIHGSTEFKHKWTICISLCDLFLICTRKMGLTPFASLFKHILMRRKKIATLIICIHGKHIWPTWDAGYVLGPGAMRFIPGPCSQSTDLTSPILTSWMFIDADAVSSRSNLPFWWIQILEASLHDTDFFFFRLHLGYIIRTKDTLYILMGWMAFMSKTKTMLITEHKNMTQSNCEVSACLHFDNKKM
jgi:hypothetical protein